MAKKKDDQLAADQIHLAIPIDDFFEVHLFLVENRGQSYEDLAAGVRANFDRALIDKFTKHLEARKKVASTFVDRVIDHFNAAMKTEMAKKEPASG